MKNIIEIILLFEKTKNFNELINIFLEKTMHLLDCEGATFFSVNEEKKLIKFEIVKGPNAEELTGITFSYKGVVGWCVEHKKDLFIKDAYNNPVFTNKVDYASGYKTRSIISMLLSYGDMLFGVIEFINPKNKEHFSEDDFYLAKLLSVFVSYQLYIMKIEEVVSHLNNRMHSTVNNLSGGFIGIDLNGNIIFLNPRAKEILKLNDDYLNKHYTQLPENLNKIIEIFNNLMKEFTEIKRDEFKILIEGKERKIGYSTIRLKAIDGSAIGYAVIFQDITDM